jgi:hypothetical protein
LESGERIELPRDDRGVGTAIKCIECIQCITAGIRFIRRSLRSRVRGAAGLHSDLIPVAMSGAREPFLYVLWNGFAFKSRRIALLARSPHMLLEDLGDQNVAL